MIYKPPMNIAKKGNAKSVFLAGSIGGNDNLTELAKDWQAEITPLFTHNGWDVFNPRRAEFDGSWVQSFENPNFYQQVNWELHALDTADLILMHFDIATKSPISLLELGLYADSGKIHVVCGDGFWRRGNVEVVCNKYNINLFDTLTEFENYFLNVISKQK